MMTENKTIIRPRNYRDIGEILGLWLPDPPIAPGKPLRGGALDSLTQWKDIGHPRTIINLRKGLDSALFTDVCYLHAPADDRVENYNTSSPRVREWVFTVISILATQHTQYPVYVHCTSGRDRTGVIVAATRLTLGVEPPIVAAEYMLSDGAKTELIGHAIAGLDQDCIRRLTVLRSNLRVKLSG